MNRLAAETSPYLRQHADEPGRLVPVGRRGLRGRPGGRPADPAVGRLRLLPLVPRHGARVVRGRRGGRPHERPVRQRQGRPGGAARRRRRLHGGDPGADRPGRLADDRVPRPRRPPVLRRDVLPPRAPGRDDLVPRAVRAHRRAVAQPPRRPRGAGRPAHRRARPVGPARPGRRPARGGRARRRRRPAGPRPRPPRGRVRRRAEVPPGHEPRLPGRRARRRPGRRPRGRRAGRRAGGGRRDQPRRHGVGRHLRPRGRRLRPLLGRRPLAGAPLREDALRRGAAGPGLPARLAGHRPRPLPAGARRDRGVRAARPAPRGRRLHVLGGRRQRGRGGPVLRLDARRPARRPRRRRGAGRRGVGVLRRHARRQLRGPHDPQPAPRPGRPGPAAGDRGGPRPAVRLPRAAGAARARRQGPHRVERPDAGHAGRGCGRHRAHRLARRRGGQRRVPPPRAAAGRRALAAVVAGRRRRPPPGLRRRPRRAGRRLRAPGRGDGRGPLARRRPGRRPTPSSPCSGTPTAAAPSPPAATPSAWSPATRT